MNKNFQRWMVGLTLLSFLTPYTVFSQIGITTGEKIEQVRVNANMGSNARSALEQLEEISGTRINVPRVNPPQSVPAASRTNSAAANAAAINNMIAGAVIQGLFNSIFSTNPAANQARIQAQQREAENAAFEAAELNRINAEKAEVNYNNMMKSYKTLDGSKSRTAGISELGLKTLDDTDITIANGIGKTDIPTTAPVIDQLGPANSTPFFGDKMTDADLETLTNIENDPNVVDLREAKQMVDEKIETESPGIVNLLRKYETEGNGEPVVQKPDCIVLGKKLKGFSEQRIQFQKTINLAQSELDVWETANYNAMMNAAKDGIEYFTGQLLEGLKKRGEAAERYQRILESKRKQMVKDGINVNEIQAKVDRCKQFASSGKLAEVTSNINDWQTFVKDGMSSLIKQLSSSNDELRDIFENPATAKYFQSEAPELNTLLDISKLAASNEVFGKWVAKKIPMIALIEISIKQIYNGTDYFLSLKRIMEARKINGGVTQTARYIQKNIDETLIAMGDCN